MEASFFSWRAEKMVLEKGWIKLHRSIQSKEFASNNNLQALWIHILLNASLKEVKAMVNGKQVKLPIGSLIFNCERIASLVNFSSKTVRKHLKYLQKTDRIELTLSTHGSYLIVKDWLKYQEVCRAPNADSNKEASAQSPNRGLASFRINGVIERKKKEEEKKEEIIELPLSPKHGAAKKKVVRKAVSRSKPVNKVSLDFLPPELITFTRNVSDQAREIWKRRYCDATLESYLQKAFDWSVAKGKKVQDQNIASLMNTFFSDVEHDKWKDEKGGVNPAEKAVAEELNSLLLAGKRERGIDA